MLWINGHGLIRSHPNHENGHDSPLETIIQDEKVIAFSCLILLYTKHPRIRASLIYGWGGGV